MADNESTQTQSEKNSNYYKNKTETQDNSGGLNPLHSETDKGSIMSKRGSTIIENNVFWHLDNSTHNLTYFPDICFDEITLAAILQNEKRDKAQFQKEWEHINGKKDWPQILKLLNSGKWTGYFPISRRARGANYPRPKRHFKLVTFYINSFQFPDELAIRTLPKEPTWFRYSWIFFGFYISNVIEKIMLQAIPDEKDLRERVVNFYPNIGIISALISGISLGSYFNGFSSNDIINTTFGFCSVASGASGIFSTIMATAYLLILLGIPECATDEFMTANLWFLGIPIFTMFSSLFFLFIAIVVIASPLYNPVVLVLIGLLATPVLLITVWALHCLIDSTMVTALDSLVEARDHERDILNEDGSVKVLKD